MIDYVRDAPGPARRAADRMLDERQRRAREFGNVEFVRPCNLCPHMKRTTLPKMLAFAREAQDEVLVDEPVRVRAQRALEAMIAL